ncbi:VOC family protein [Xenorhabdus bovienii]|uniref:VOC family protein n=1 Tax=Xenorhabdus bovienii TaxID=40576 RepID=UPI0023B23A19|nr:VOC family protein [Xenorhabdus bovienii]MDE9482423.1 VOC family protein [Xenorhabdus bovienii]MDE9556299.1 VOC family protein [Xenorhabdus bovienii]
MNNVQLCQIALCSQQIDLTLKFYQAITAFQSCGGLPIRGEIAARLFNVPHIEGRSYWMAEGEDFFQLEFFSLQQPEIIARRPEIDRPGYNLIAFRVKDIGDVLHRLRAQHFVVHPNEQLIQGVRHVLIRDPDGVLVELVEEPQQPPAVLGIGITVRDLADAQCFFSEGFSLTGEEHQPDAREKLWQPAATPSALLRFSVGERWIEVRHCPSDQDDDREAFSLVKSGIANIALGCSLPETFNALFTQVIAQGFTSATQPISFLEGNNAYLRSGQCLSVELLQLPKHTWGVWGFCKPDPAAQQIQEDISRRMLML